MKFKDLNIGDVFTTNDKDNISLYIKTQDTFLGDLKFSKALKLSTFADVLFLDNSQVELIKKREDIDWDTIF